MSRLVRLARAPNEVRPGLLDGVELGDVRRELRHKALKEMLAAAIRSVPAPFQNKILVRIDDAEAGHERITHLPSLPFPRKTVLHPAGG